MARLEIHPFSDEYLAPAGLLSSRSWPARGFKATFLRLYRHIP